LTLGYSITNVIVLTTASYVNFRVCEVKSMLDSLREMDKAVLALDKRGKKNLLAQLGIEPRSPPLCL